MISVVHLKRSPLEFPISEYCIWYPTPSVLFSNRCFPILNPWFTTWWLKGFSVVNLWTILSFSTLNTVNLLYRPRYIICLKTLEAQTFLNLITCLLKTSIVHLWDLLPMNQVGALPAFLLLHPMTRTVSLAWYHFTFYLKKCRRTAKFFRTSFFITVFSRSSFSTLEGPLGSKSESDGRRRKDNRLKEVRYWCPRPIQFIFLKKKIWLFVRKHFSHWKVTLEKTKAIFLCYTYPCIT